MKEKQLFVKTTDEAIAEQLMILGFQLVNHDAITWTFLNEPKSLNFDKVEKSKIAFSNVLTV